MTDLAETVRRFCIGRQVQYRPPSENPNDQPATVHLIKSRPVSTGGQMTVRITGRDEPVPLAHLRIDMGRDSV